MRFFDLMKEYLANEGYRYDIDSDGDIHFKYEGVNLYFTDNGDDQSFFRIIMPNIYEVENNREKVLEAVNAVCRDIKVVKAFLLRDSLWLAVEMFIDGTPDVGDFFSRCLGALMAARKKAAEEIMG